MPVSYTHLGKSTIAVLQPGGTIARHPFDVPHTSKSLAQLAHYIRSLKGETRIVMECTGRYHEPIANTLHCLLYTSYQFSCVIGLLLFGTLSAVMSNNLVIKEYSGKRLALLFSYPVSRRKIFMGKVWIILLFSFLSTLFCTSIPIAIFSVTETVLPIVSDTISADLLTETIQMIIFSALSVSAAGLLAMGMGFMRKMCIRDRENSRKR